MRPTRPLRSRIWSTGTSRSISDRGPIEPEEREPEVVRPPGVARSAPAEEVQRRKEERQSANDEEVSHRDRLSLEATVIGMREHLDEEARDPHTEGQVQCDRRETAGHSSRRVQKPWGSYSRITRKASTLGGSVSRTSATALRSHSVSARIRSTELPGWNDARTASPSTKRNTPRVVMSTLGPPRASPCRSRHPRPFP